MIIPGILAQRRYSGGAPALWTPLNMATVPRIYLDAQDSVVTNIGGFASAISNLGAMGANGDFSQATAGNRPAIVDAALSGKRILSFDGTNDVLTGGSSQQLDLFRNVAAAWVFSVYKKRVTDASGTRIVLSTQIGSAPGTRFSMLAGLSPGINQPSLQGRRLDADTLANLNSGTVVVGSYMATFAGVNFSTRAAQIIIDGGTPTTSAFFTAAAGNTSDAASIAAIAIGAVISGAAAADIDLAAMVISNTQPTASDIDKLFGWAAHKYGLTANLPSGHPYKTVAPTV